MKIQKSSVCGKLKIQVVNINGEVVRDYGWKNNLILDQGMTGIATRSWAKSFEYAVAGTGSAPTFDTYNVPILNTSGTTINATGSVFVNSMIGKLINLGESPSGVLRQANITAVNSPTQAVLDAAIDITTGPAITTFFVHRVDQTSLVTELLRSNAYVAGNCGWSTAPLGYSMWRTFDFRIETGAHTYTEFGFSWTNSPGANLFSRVVPVSPIVVNIGEKLRLLYQLDFTIAGCAFSPPVASVPSPVIGWNGNIQANWNWPLVDQISSAGATIVGGGVGGASSVMEPSGAGLMFLSSVNTPPNLFFGDDNRVGTAFVTKAFTPVVQAQSGGVFSLIKRAVFGGTEGNGGSWYSVGLTSNGAPGVNNGFVVVYDSAQIKLSTQSLQLDFLFSWARNIIA